MSEWTVVLSARAEKDLEQIYDYIAAALLEPGTASAQVSRIKNSIKSLSSLPERCAQIRYEPWRSLRLRYVQIDNYLAVYQVDKGSKTVSVITVVYARRDLPGIL